MIKEPYILPVTCRPNQTFKTKIVVDKENIELTIHLNFREVCGYWTMDLLDKEGKMLLSNAPLIKADDPADNLLYQFDYLSLGYLMIYEANNTGAQYPGATQLGTDFLLVWGSSHE